MSIIINTMGDTMDIKNNKKFIKFCTKLGFEYGNDLKTAELVESNYNNEKDELTILIKFNNVVNVESFLAFRNALKANHIANVVQKYDFHQDQYKKENIMPFIDAVRAKRPKYVKLREFNFDRYMKIDGNNLSIIVYKKSDVETFESLMNSLFNRLRKYGFSNMNFYFGLKPKEEITKEQMVKIKADEERKNIAKKKLIEQQLIADKKEEIALSNANKFNSFSGRSWARRSYETMDIDNISKAENKTNVSFIGRLFNIAFSTSKNNKFVCTFGLTDYKNAIDNKWFRNEDFSEKEKEFLVDGQWVKVTGSVDQNYRNGKKENSIFVNTVAPIENPYPIRKDNAPKNRKRVELHVCSKMNTMDSLIEPESVALQAKAFDMPAVAIIDTDGAQGFPKFYNTAKAVGIKALYGVSFSIIDKSNNVLLGETLNGKLKDVEYVSFDIETSGLSPKFAELIEYGSITIQKNLKLGKTKQMFVKTKKLINYFTENLTGITNEMLQTKGLDIKDALKAIYDDLNGKVAIAHNATFDFNFLKEKFRENNMPFPHVTVVDSLVVSRITNPEAKKHKLEDVSTRYGVDYDPNVAHRGDYDATVLAKVWIYLMNSLNIKQHIDTFERLKSFTSEDLYKKTFAYEVSVLAKNQAGLKEQFELLNESLITNLNCGSKIFWDDLKNKENLLIGSGTLKSLLYESYFYRSHEDFLDKLSRVDYVEIPAPQVFSHWVEDGSITQEQLEYGLKDIINEAIKHHKIPVATGDVRYLDLNDKLSYEILVYAKGIKNARHYLYDYKRASTGKKLFIPNQQFLTTQEMLDQFAFLGDKKLIEEVVIDNSQKIANMCENIQVIKNKLYTPIFDDSANKLRALVYENAHKKYGEIIPEVLEKRIEAELNPIINYGFSVIYWISYRLIKKSNDSGYVVGSRGSVGSSFVATLCGISEVNPLEPHYLCEKCKHFEFANIPEITSGFDLPDKNCPECHNKMTSDGQGIPFETFLGFKADKVPDIDLNFSGDFQGEIHKEVRKLFGESHTFKAGTISKVAPKTGYGYVKAYMEETHKDFNDAFIVYLASKLEGVKRTTGQHPGGIIIIPKEYDVTDFTPVNYPANEVEADWFTTHFDYKAIHDNVLKLDLLGHDNPTIIKMLERYTGVNIDEVPKKDPKVLSIFTSTKSLNIKPSDISGEPTGALGLPEFGTSFVRQMLHEANPKTFADLISISGLSHGENVWLNNAEELINKKGFTIKDVISCRDDIMTMLIHQGVEKSFAFKVMEKVRKGKGLTPEEEKELKGYKIPQWQIDSMKKIKYMFPKAHATAYVLMAWWIAWFKVYYPLAHYASYFATHAKALELESMIDIKQGTKTKDRLAAILAIPKNERSTKEDDLIPVFEIVQELYARGFYITNIDLEKSQAHEWIIDNDKGCLIPPFEAIDGLGPAVAVSIVKARNQKPFSSIDDFSRRTSVNKTLTKKMEDMGIFINLASTDQLTLF